MPSSSHSGTLTPLLKKLEQKGYITRKRSKEDERNLIINITEKGMNLREMALFVPEAMGKCIELESDKALRLHELVNELLEIIK